MPHYQSNGADLRGRGKAAEFYTHDVTVSKGHAGASLPTADRSLDPEIWANTMRDEDLPRETLCPGPRAEAVRLAHTTEPAAVRFGTPRPLVLAFVASVSLTAYLVRQEGLRGAERRKHAASDAVASS
eukprot:Rhum_TRINITY_DN8165_c0_g1::Rhum_TRINITY_DN8165_c0_g1_i2::g.26458::m.26458